MCVCDGLHVLAKPILMTKKGKPKTGYVDRYRAAHPLNVNVRTRIGLGPDIRRYPGTGYYVRRDSISGPGPPIDTTVTNTTASAPKKDWSQRMAYRALSFKSIPNFREKNRYQEINFRNICKIEIKEGKRIEKGALPTYSKQITPLPLISLPDPDPVFPKGSG